MPKVWERGYEFQKSLTLAKIDKIDNLVSKKFLDSFNLDYRESRHFKCDISKSTIQIKMDTNKFSNKITLEMVMKGIQDLLKVVREQSELIREQSELIRELKAKEFAKPIELVKVDKGSFNFPISSLTKLEGVGKLKLPESFLLIPNFVDPDILTYEDEFLRKPYHVLFSIREIAFSFTISNVLEEKAKENVFYQNQMEFLFFFYEFDISKSISFLSHLEDFLYDLYEFNISKFLSW